MGGSMICVIVMGGRYVVMGIERGSSVDVKLSLLPILAYRGLPPLGLRDVLRNSYVMIIYRWPCCMEVGMAGHPATIP